MTDDKKTLKLARSKTEIWRTVLAAIQVVIALTTLIVVLTQR